MSVTDVSIALAVKFPSVLVTVSQLFRCDISAELQIRLPDTEKSRCETALIS